MELLTELKTVCRKGRQNLTKRPLKKFAVGIVQFSNFMMFA